MFRSSHRDRKKYLIDNSIFTKSDWFIRISVYIQTDIKMIDSSYPSFKTREFWTVTANVHIARFRIYFFNIPVFSLNFCNYHLKKFCFCDIRFNEVRLDCKSGVLSHFNPINYRRKSDYAVRFVIVHSIITQCSSVLFFYCQNHV